MRPESRSPAARLIRARTLSANWEQSKPTHCYEERVVLAYAKFLHELDTLDGQQHDRYLSLRPVMAETHYLASSTEALAIGGVRNTPMVVGLPVAHEAERPNNAASKDRALVKAFILGGVPVEEIADMLDFRQESVFTFESLAFDVRSRLHKKAWLHNYVFSDSVMCSTSIHDFERLCLTTVYRHGVEALKRMLFVGDIEEFTEAMRKQLRADMASKAGVSLATMPLNVVTIPEVVNGYNNWEKTERDMAIKEKQADRAKDTESDMADGILSAVTEVSFAVSERDVDSEPMDGVEENGDRAFAKAVAEVLKEMKLDEELTSV